MQFWSAQTVYAATNPAVTNLVQKINQFVLNPIIGFLFALAFIFFLWGVAEFIFRADVESERTRGKKHMIWGLVGMFVMFAAFTIIRIIANTLGVEAPGLP